MRPRVVAAQQPQQPVDMINHPPHYASGAIECIDAMREQLGPDGFISYLRGAIMKYGWRMDRKGTPLEDAKKLRWYADRLVRELENA